MILACVWAINIIKKKHNSSDSSAVNIFKLHFQMMSEWVH